MDWILSKIDAISKRIENWKGEQSWVSKLNTDKIKRTLEWNVRKRVNNFVKVIITCAMKQINRLFPLPWVQHPNSNISLQHFGFYSNFISRSILTDNIFCRCFTFRVYYWNSYRAKGFSRWSISNATHIHERVCSDRVTYTLPLRI